MASSFKVFGSFTLAERYQIRSLTVQWTEGGWWGLLRLIEALQSFAWRKNIQAGREKASGTRVLFSLILLLFRKRRG